MNAIADTAYTRCLGALGQRLATPRAILCISAHWMTDGAWVTGMKTPRTIHDFRGFPDALFQIQYPAPGSPELAASVAATVTHPKVGIDSESWGLDHGTWSVLRHLYPDAGIPVVQLSIDLSQPPEYHYELGKQLQSLRTAGVLIVGSGNIVHNLRRIRWESEAKPYDWAIEFDEWVKARLLAGDYESLVKDALKTEAGRLSVPTPDHYLPLLCVLGAAATRDALRFEYEEIQNASISMRCFSLG